MKRNSYTQEKHHSILYENTNDSQIQAQKEQHAVTSITILWLENTSIQRFVLTDGLSNIGNVRVRTGNVLSNSISAMEEKSLPVLYLAW